MKNADYLRAGKFKLLFETLTKDRTLRTKCVRVPEQGKRFVAATSDERHLNALPPNLIPVQTTDGTYGLS